MKIAIVEDNMVLADLLSVLCSQLGHEVVGTASDGKAAVAMVVSSQPELAILDLGLVGIDGFRVIDLMRELGSHCKVLVLSGHCNPFSIARSLELRVEGFLSKASCHASEIQAAIQNLESGQPSFCSDFLRIKHELSVSGNSATA